MSARGNSAAGSPAASAINLHHRGVLQHDRADHCLCNGRANDYNTVVLEQHSAMQTERLSDARAHRVDCGSG